MRKRKKKKGAPFVTKERPDKCKCNELFRLHFSQHYIILFHGLGKSSDHGQNS